MYAMAYRTVMLRGRDSLEEAVEVVPEASVVLFVAVVAVTETEPLLPLAPPDKFTVPPVPV
jgi:hypothetical protein